MRKFLLVSFLTLFSVASVFAQSRVVSGKVISSEDGLPIPGVGVLIKGTTTGAPTDFDGDYRIEVSGPDAVLVFQAVGMVTKEVRVGNQTTINVTLDPDTKTLQEVVVTGYSELDKRKLTGAVSKVEADKIENVPMASLDQILQGTAPGLLITAGTGQPGSAANIRIRGIGSINASTTPLFIMDGVPISNNAFATINPNDIESVNVLKDAAAASIYGSRAANGVIVITTKKGKAGKTQLFYRGQQGITTRTQNQFTNMNTAQRIEFETAMAERGFPSGRVGAVLLNNNLTQEQKDAQIAAFAAIDTDWADFYFRDGALTSHEISARGGNEKTTFFVSANYRNEEGIIQQSDLQRGTIRLNLQHSVSDRLRFGLNSSFGYSESNFIVETGNSLVNPALVAYLELPYLLPRNPETGEFNRNGIAGYNLLEQLNNSTDSRQELKGITNIFAEIDLIDDLTLRTSWGIDYTQRFGVNDVTPIAPNQGGIRGSRGRVSRSFLRASSIIGTTTLQYSKTIGDHTFSVLIGNEILRANQRAFNYTGFGINPKLVNPAGITPGTATNGFIPTVGGSNTDNGLLSFFFDGSYTYKDRYNFSAGFRRDGSSRFGVDTRFANFWSLGASWNLNEEAFLSDVSFIDDLKIRGSYGTQGNQEGIGNFSYLGTFGQSFYNGVAGIAPSNLSNPLYQWELLKTANIGIDFSLFSGKVNGSFEFYNNNTEELFIPTQLSRTTGFAEQDRNAGKMRNRGIEVNLSVDLVRANNFVWNLGGNFTYNQNRIIDLFQEDQFELGTSIVREGLPFGSHYVVEWAGVNPSNGEPLYRDRDGNVTNMFNAATMSKAFGTWDPPYFGGFTNTISYKGLEVSLFFTYVWGNQLFNNQRFFNNNPQSFGAFNQDAELLNYWREPGQITNVPGLQYPRQFSSQDLESGAFLRLRNALVSYNFPSTWTSKLKIASARVYIQGQNLLTFTEFTGFDPENNNNIVLSKYPAPRSYTLGIDIGF